MKNKFLFKAARIIVLIIITSFSTLLAVNSFEEIIPTPDQLNDKIKTANINNFVTDTAKLEKAVKDCERGVYKKIDSLLIAKDGKLILEKYFRNWSRHRLHPIQSITKSISALLIGEAIEKGYISNINDPILKYLPSYHKYFSKGKEKITIKHLLTMSAGLMWNESIISYSSPLNDAVKEYKSKDGVRYTISKKLYRSPGSSFSYNGGLVNMLGNILQNASKSENIEDYLSKSFLLKELNGKPYEFPDDGLWMKTLDGRPSLAGGLLLNSRSMLKFGLFVLNKGTWNNKQLIDKKYIQEMTSKQITSHNNYYPDYGYYWWIKNFKIGKNNFKAITALGYGGQFIMIIEKLNLVIVSTASNYDNYPNTFYLIENYIIPSFI